MNIVQINQTQNFGSTGKIMRELNSVIISHGHRGYCVCGYSYEKEADTYKMSSGNQNVQIRKNLLISRITGVMGYRQKNSTKKMLAWIDEKKPDIIHLHNIHGDWVNIFELFRYIRKKNIPIVWTLHDCWSFTGRCSHFERAKCEKWIEGCYSCKNSKVYPKTYFFDFSKKMWNDKFLLFRGLNIHIVTPSLWLSDYVKNSFLKEYPIKVINNGINTDIYRIINGKSKYLSNDKKIILGVASSWSKMKGLDDFLKINELIDHSKYQIVLVGLNNKQLQIIPKNIIGIARTNNQEELVELYNSADVFVNPTYQDNFPTTNLEAAACGTVTITYRTGGSPESIIDNRYIVDQGDIRTLVDRIIEVCEKPKYSKDDMRLFAEKKYNKYSCYEEYLRLYESIYKNFRN